MDRNCINGRFSPSSSAERGGVRSAGPTLQPNYSSRAVQEALEHLASVELIELCSEAKVERCRATRDLRSCGRYVHYVLNSCGHASLCSECSQRCELCPICRIPIPKNGNRLRLRLFYECIEAGLISKRFDERFLEKEDGSSQLTADVQRLYSLFDVAIENNLVSLICHYVTDVCMDETAVSSDPVLAFLLDEVVVKDWCKRTFKNIVAELRGIYDLEAEEMETRLNLLIKLLGNLVGMSYVLEVLESSFKGSLSAQLHDLQCLKENILTTKQHAEIMMWCIRHHFLGNVRSRYTDITTWRSAVRERKMAAIKRSWPDVVNQVTESSMQVGSLFIEDALANLEIEQVQVQEMEEESELVCLQKGGRAFFVSKIEGLAGCYPFESLRDAVDILFLCGSSDSVVAKQAIFIYYLFDRYRKMPEETWKDIMDDFAATFGITRHSLLESLTFYLLDDHTDEALQEACDLLPEISGPSTHSKISQVLLERQVPEMALMVLRWTGRDGSQMVSLSEAVTGVRVRVECGLLTEAFMHQRMLCTKVRKKKLKGGVLGDSSGNLKDECRNWEDWVEILVTEICCLCIKNNLVDRIIELPWDVDEEKYIHKCLLDCAVHDPSTTTGSLLVVFYLQRYRYADAYQVDLKLQSVEQDFISNNSDSDEVLSRIRLTSQWRRQLVDKSIQLLPQVQQQHVKTGKLPQGTYNISDEEVEFAAKSDVPMVVQEQPKSSSLLVPPAGDSSLVLQRNHANPFNPSVLATPSRFGGSFNNSIAELGNYGPPSVIHERFSTYAEKRLNPRDSISKNFKNDVTPASRTNRGKSLNATPFKEIGESPIQVLNSTYLSDVKFDKISPETEQNGFAKQFQTTTPYILKDMSTPVSMSHRNHGFPNDSSRFPSSILSSKSVHSNGDDRFWDATFGDDAMDVARSGGEKGFDMDERIEINGLRWRSDETSDEDDNHSADRHIGVVSHTTPTTRIRRSRFARS